MGRDVHRPGMVEQSLYEPRSAGELRSNEVAGSLPHLQQQRGSGREQPSVPDRGIYAAGWLTAPGSAARPMVAGIPRADRATAPPFAAERQGVELGVHRQSAAVGPGHGDIRGGTEPVAAVLLRSLCKDLLDTHDFHLVPFAMEYLAICPCTDANIRGNSRCALEC